MAPEEENTQADRDQDLGSDADEEEDQGAHKDSLMRGLKEDDLQPAN